MIYAENIFVCLAAPLLVSMAFMRQAARRFLFFFILGMLSCLVGAYFNSFIAAREGLDALDAVLIAAPMVEEISKFLPLLFYVVVFEPPPRRIVDVALAIGTGFATFENACYITQFNPQDLLLMLIRGLAVGAMHVGCMLMVGLGLRYSRTASWPGLPATIGVLGIAIIYHGVYNVLVSYPGPMRWVGYGLPLLVSLVTALYFYYVPYTGSTGDNEPQAAG